MTNAQILMLADIQRMALVFVPGQTGHQGRHDVQTFIDGGAWSVVSAYDASNERAYHSYVSIETDGTELPDPQAGPDAPRTLGEQHLELAKWIVANRQQEVA